MTNFENLELKYKELQKENSRLRGHMDLLGDELRKYYARLCEYEREKALFSGNSGFEAHIAEMRAANSRMAAHADIERRYKDLENSMRASLAKKNASAWSLKAFLSRGGYNKPTKKMGGSTFQHLIAQWRKGGLEAVDKMLDAENCSPVLRANAYTAIAKNVREKDIKSCAALARLAWSCEPKPYRLKWLVFRLMDAGEVQEAEALLDMLPEDTGFADSETRRIVLLRSRSAEIYMNEARQSSGQICMRLIQKRNEELEKDRAFVELREEANLLKLQNEQLLLENRHLSDDVERLEMARSRILFGQDSPGQPESLQSALEYLLARQEALLAEIRGLEKKLEHSAGKSETVPFLRLREYFLPDEMSASLPAPAKNMNSATLCALASVVEANSHDLVIGFGLGGALPYVSAFLRRRGKNSSACPARLVDFEASGQKLDNLAPDQKGAWPDLAEINISGIKNYVCPDKGEAAFYDCEADLQALAKDFKGERILAVIGVDREKEPEVRPCAVFKMLRSCFRRQTMDIFAPDTPGMRDLLTHWRDITEQSGLQCSFEECGGDASGLLLKLDAI